MTNEEAVKVLHLIDSRIRLGMNVGWSDRQVSAAFACAMAALTSKQEETPKPPVGYVVEVKNPITEGWAVKYVQPLGLSWGKSKQFPYTSVERWEDIEEWRYIPPLEWKEGSHCFAYFKSGECCFLTEARTIGLVLPDGGEIIHVLTYDEWLEKEVAE